jgi:hypothetical protein
MLCQSADESVMPRGKMMSMKNSIFYILAVLMANSFAQDNNSDLAFYPLQDGNYWEYSETHTNATIFVKQINYSLEVIGDTVLSNNLQYKVIQKKFIPDTIQASHVFERIDSTTGNIYRFSNEINSELKEYLIDSLYSQLGDTSKSFRNMYPFSPLIDIAKTMVLYTGIDTSLGTNAFYKDFYFLATIPGFHYRLAEDIGLVRYVNSGEVIYVDTKLKFANIQGTEFGNRIIVNVDQKKEPVYQCHLYQNYPNPFNSKTNIFFWISNRSEVELNIYNILGKRIHTYSKFFNEPGKHYIQFTIDDLPSGIYIYELRASGNVIRKQFSLIR